MKRTRSEYEESLRYNIKDATEALRAATSMGDWNGVIKYANQLKALERKLTDAQPRWAWNASEGYAARHHARRARKRFRSR